MATTRMVLVRHGQTTGNAGRLLHGSTDLPLDSTGERQAQLVADRIGAEFPADALLSSPLKRARSTAVAISTVTGLAIEERLDLREMDFGDLEGFSIDRLQTEFPAIASQTFDPRNSTMQWPNGDRVDEFFRRSADAFETIAEQFIRQTVVVVAHGGVIGAYLRSIAGLPPNDWQSFRLLNCSISIVDVNNRTHRVILQNDGRHLDKSASGRDETNAQ